MAGQTPSRLESESGARRGRDPDHERLPVLDGLRGLAILMVTVVHLGSAELDGRLETGSLIERLYAKVATHATAGVDLFFVLSGFLITRILLRAREQPHYLRNFYARRILRISPLYYLTLALVFFVIIPFILPPSQARHELVRQQGWLWLYLSNVAASFFGITWKTGSIFLAHFWSLAVEEHFYLVWPFLVLIVASPNRLLALCGGLIVGAAALRLVFLHFGMIPAAYLFTLSRADGLGMGAAVAILARRDGGIGSLRTIADRLLVASLGALALLAVAGARKTSVGGWTTALVHSAYPTLFAAVMVRALASPPRAPLARFLASDFLRFFGRYSYGLYVWHALMVPLFVATLPLARFQSALGSRLGGLFVFYLIALAVSTGAAMVSWHLYEKHFLKLKRLFEWRGPAPAGAPSGG